MTTIANKLSEQEFNDLCFDHFPAVAKSFAEGQSRNGRVRSLIEYAENHKQLDQLERAIKEINPVALEEAIDLPNKASESGPSDVLVVAANAQGMTTLALEQEAAVIAKQLFVEKPKRDLRVFSRMATGAADLSGLLLAHDPMVVHFAGHGTPEGNLIFADETGGQQIVEAEELGELFQTVGGRVECVTLNSCWSAAQADALLSRGVPCVVGMTSRIDDESATQFSSGFYEALAYGRDYATAVELGRSKIRILGLPDREAPHFVTNDPRMFDPDIAISGLSLGTPRSQAGWPYIITDKAPVVEEGSGDAAVPKVKLFYGTNRKLKDPAKPSKGYGTERENKLNYGTCSVRVPKDHRKKGTLSSSFWWKLWTGIDDTVRLDNDSITPLKDDVFWQQAREQLKNAPTNEQDVLVFVHGFRVNFKDAAIRAAQISADMNFPGLTAFFSWPSLGRLIGYVADGATIEASEPLLTEFLTQILQESGGKKIHLIAHSMGNRGVLKVMENVIDQVRSKNPKAFGQILLAAPDVDVEVFQQNCAVYQQAALQTTLYASPRDWAVWASSIVNWHDRVGYHPPVTVFDGIDTVRVDKVDMDSIGHGYVGAAKDVMNDMDKAIRFQATPHDRGLEKRETEEGHEFWEILG
ncbi:MAG: alpha/beta hydrolase [Planctomycetes bacterium]|nr:alpha/beta hydrolase [Planctomycetota bacterium]